VTTQSGLARTPADYATWRDCQSSHSVTSNSKHRGITDSGTPGSPDLWSGLFL